MSWARFDDLFYAHPKLAVLADLMLQCVGLHLLAVCYASSYLTDGFVPRAQVPRLAGDLPDGASVWTLVGRLVAAGMWEEREGGYAIHDYLDYNPSKREVLKLRKDRALSGQAGGLAKARRSASKRLPNDVAGKEQKSAPVPVPAPTAEVTPSAPATAGAGDLKVALAGKNGTAAPTGGGHPAVTAYCDAWRGRYGRAPDIAGKDAAALARLWKKQGAEEYARRLGRYLGDADPFLVKVAHSAGQFESRWNALGVAAGGGPPDTRANLNDRWKDRPGGEVSL